MSWDRKRLLGYVETIQLILGVTDKSSSKTIFSVLSRLGDEFQGLDLFYVVKKLWYLLFER